MNMILKVLTLDFANLKGLRTVIGAVGLALPAVIDNFTNAGLCVAYPSICAGMNTLSSWFLIMGIRGK